MKTNNQIYKNTAMMMLLNISKLVFPFITLPYLTRVLTTDCYGVVAYVKAVMSYMQIIVDFGFGLSATKSIAENRNNKFIVGKILGINIGAKMLLIVLAGLFLSIASFMIPILKQNIVYTLFSYIPVALTIFSLDFLFKGIEKMHVITVRFVIMKFISTVLTFGCIKRDADIIKMPLWDIVGTLIAIIWIGIEVKKLDIHVVVPNLRECILEIKRSAIYFVSTFASTSFNVFNTVVSGIVLSSTEIAYWSVSMQIINAMQALYTPVSDAIYPEMIRSKNSRLIKKVIELLGPIVCIVCILLCICGKWILYIVGGNKYVEAYSTLKYLLPVLVFGFGSVILGWPALGAIGKVRETSLSTVVASGFQMISVLLLTKLNLLSLAVMAVLRSITELILCLIRLRYCIKYKNGFK